jgi:hypothetical protein
MDVSEAGPDQNSSCELAPGDGSGGQHYLHLFIGNQCRCQLGKFATPVARACQIGMSLPGQSRRFDGRPGYFRHPINRHSRGPAACFKGATNGLMHRSNSRVGDT